MRKMFTLTMGVVLSLTMLAGCGQGQQTAAGVGGDAAKAGAQSEQGAKNEKQAAPQGSQYDPITKPITLTVLWSGREDQYKDRVESPIVKAKMPNVTFEYHNLKEGLENLIASGVKLDVMNITPQVFFNAKELGLVDDLTPLIKKHNFDMSRFVPEHIEIIKKLTNDGKMDGFSDKAYFPYVNHALVYNKDIFDKFAVPYPKDGMTWDEVIELAKRLTREDGGQQYYGVLFGSAQDMFQQLALSYFDKNGKVDLSNPLFKEIFRVNNEAYKVIGRDPIASVTPFIKDKNIAMFAGNVRSLIEEADRSKSEQPNWDIATYPSFKDHPLVVPPIVGVYTIASTSEHKDAALQLIDILLGQELSKDIVDQYMNPTFKKMNVKAVESVKQALYITNKYDSDGNGLLNSTIRDLNKNGGDINTAIRDMQDALQKKIDEQK